METELIKLIDKSIFEVKNYADQYHSHDNPHVLNTLKVLNLLREDTEKKGLAINSRILRAFKDISTLTAIHFEESNFNDPIFEVYSYLNRNIPQFEGLDLLRMDFGKGNPI